MSKRAISAYTPSNTDPATRERIFVQRHKLLKRVVAWCSESMLTGNKHHLLFIGPRGCGKTHLVSMVQDRLLQMPKLTDKMRIAWLGEDSVFTGLIDVALEIADELSNSYPEEFAYDYRSHAKTLVADEAAESILNEVLRRLGDRSILLIMENLDRAFHGLGDLGQKKWRAFLQENGRVATLATSQHLFEDVSSRDAAFYGFFEIIHLEPLSVDDARQLMTNIARENKNAPLVEFLSTSEGRYRVRALRHLAGGNHRMYVMLSEFLTKESLDSLVDAFEGLAEDLTPYFQERVRSLSPQQARIVQSLCNASGAITVKEVAEDTFIAERNVSKQLGELKQKGYVISERRGKESYYEMAEPLMRLCLEVKKQRGKPLKLVASFLRAWFSDHSLCVDLQSSLCQSHGTESRIIAYKQAALRASESFRDMILRDLLTEFDQALASGDHNQATELADELMHDDRPRGLLLRSQVAREQRRLSDALKDLNDALAMPEMTPQLRAAILLTRSAAHFQGGDREQSVADLSAVIEMSEAPVEARTQAQISRGIMYGQLELWEKERADYSAVIAMKDAPDDERAWAQFFRGLSHSHKDLNKSLADYESVLAMENASSDVKSRAMIGCGLLHHLQGESSKAIAVFNAVIDAANESIEQVAWAQYLRAECHLGADASQDAIADYGAVMEMIEAPVDLRAKARNNRGYLYWQAAQFDAALDDFRLVSEMRDVGSAIRNRALFCIPLALLPRATVDASLEAIERAFVEGDPTTSEYGGTSADILTMVLRREPGSWPDCVEKLIAVYARHDALNLLGSGLTESIAVLDTSDFSASQLELWNAAWARAGEDRDELSIPLAALDAAVQVIKTGNDRPLFALPLEIRQFVIPLLKNTLSQQTAS